MNENTGNWYIVKQENGTCQIQQSDRASSPQAASRWGPFVDRQAAIARKIGLIRAGFCQPE